MVYACRNTIMVIAFIAVASVSILWDLNGYIACGLALAASVAAGFCVERAFINRSHREMISLHGADWQVAGGEREGPASTGKAKE
ncbi:hypothetical protein [Bradyrhizobium arachidis]|uniref:hypothetical protein n=1 Tax=Bradyrhizobium arachidis TaxID=858423 RepID=UPI002161A8BF|nr:hypothetical protein [Bradyrhizobium arachidis]UVO30516.1 hypothetical protein KUF59_07535 [Bradyrhizobium arachidis]